VHEHDPGIAVGEEFRTKRRAHAGAGAGIALDGGRQRLVGHQLRLHHQPRRGAERLDLVQDGRDRALRERDETH
jgi:hypothetical protein